MRRRNKILLLLFALFTSGLALAAFVIYSMQDMISTRLEKGWILPPLELYSQGLPLSPGRVLNRKALEEELQRHNLNSGRDYVLDDLPACAQASGLTFTSPHCLWIKEPAVAVGWDEDGWIRELWSGSPLAPATHFALFPRLITQFYDGQPIMQQNTPLAEVPLQCLQAVTAIEDKDFLEHKGVSATGTLRAVMRNLRHRRFAEGGSTITQQLVKNFFLTAKKTIRRKLEEQALAIMLESQLSKDQILEMYLNVIYMGQNGPYQVRGLGSASLRYFDKPIAQLNLPECALLAAIINSPGRYNPWEKADNAKARRELVLKKMVEAGMIDEREQGAAASAPMPPAPVAQARAHAPYFVMSALKEFQSLDMQVESGARIYTTLDADAQNILVDSVTKILPVVEKRVKKPSKQPLQVAALTIDLQTAQTVALIGGRDYRATQFNRATDARRQIGSIIKPWVYWPALKDNSPLTEVIDEPFEWKVGKQVWKPRNYEKGNEGAVPYFYALADSLNVPAAKVGQQVGLESVAEAIRRSGIRTEVPLLPSLTLGAFELSLQEVAQGYSTLARLGRGAEVHTLRKVEDFSGNTLFSREASEDLALEPIPTAVLVGMMEQAVEFGTAKAARAWGLKGAYAGKTGTTSDTKDAWFAGFNGRLLTVVWVGYDDNTVMGLTGGGAALPVWVDMQKKLETLYQATDFQWPAGTELRTLSKEEILKQYPHLKNLPDSLTLVFTGWAS
ncbi:MAG: transglycosylase domain-containing protein [Bdellovibrionales bacterium]|nr:transglycosylase domain-containing protein [Bdellovibrionales bacterium]